MAYGGCCARNTGCAKKENLKDCCSCRKQLCEYLHNLIETINFALLNLKTEKYMLIQAVHHCHHHSLT